MDYLSHSLHYILQKQPFIYPFEDVFYMDRILYYLQWKSFDLSCNTSFYVKKCLISTSVPQLKQNKKTKGTRLKTESQNSHRNIFHCNNFGGFIFKKDRTKCHVASTRVSSILRLCQVSQVQYCWSKLSYVR